VIVPVISALSLGLCLLALLVVRGRPAIVQLAVDLVSLGILSLVLARAHAGPITTTTAGESISWMGAIAVGWWLFACRATVSLLRALLRHDKRSREMRLFSDLLSAGIYLATTLAVLGLVFRLPIGGLVATSGLVAIVLGLALQSTLADVFAGIAVGVEQPFRVGDRIRLSDGVEGRVEQMNWRSIRLRTDQDDLAVIPNSAIAKAQIVNRSSPTERGMVRAEFTAPATADPDRVFELIRMATMLVPDVLPDPESSTLLLRVGERTNSYVVSFTVADTARAPQARSEVLRHARRQMEASGLVAGASPDCGGRLLREATLFESLAEDQLRTIERAMGQRRLVTGETLFEQGASEAMLYFLAEGVIEITRACEGVTEPLGRIGAGDYVGEIGLLTGSPRIATATALTDVRVYVLAKPALDPLILDNEAVAKAFEASVRRSRSRYSRSQAAAQMEDIGRADDLLARIVHFFSRS
jgi:small-conductance mechanosensitive channel/CRP-like cAMP-binding protein